MIEENTAAKVPDMEYLQTFIELTSHLPDNEFIGRLGVEVDSGGWHNLPIRLEHIRTLWGERNVENPQVNYSKIIADTASQHYNVRDEYKDNTIEENIAIQKAQSRKFSVGVINITGELNIGMMIRSACLLGAENFYIFGRKKFDKRSTVGAENYINIVQVIYDDPMTAEYQLLADLRILSTRHTIFACEQGGVTLGSEDCENVYLSCRNTMFLFGSESHGIPQLILDQKDPFGYPDYEFPRISIPQVGVLRSFNVAAAMNIICWDYIKEMK